MCPPRATPERNIARTVAPPRAPLRTLPCPTWPSPGMSQPIEAISQAFAGLGFVSVFKRVPSLFKLNPVVEKSGRVSSHYWPSRYRTPAAPSVSQNFIITTERAGPANPPPEAVEHFPAVVDPLAASIADDT